MSFWRRLRPMLLPSRAIERACMRRRNDSIQADVMLRLSGTPREQTLRELGWSPACIRVALERPWT